MPMRLRAKFQRMTIREQLLVSFSLLVVLLIVALLILSTSYLSRQTMERRAVENQQIALHIAKEIDSQIENMEAAKRQFLYSTDTMLAYSEYLRTHDVSRKSSAFNQVNAALYRVMNNGVPQIYLMAVHGDDGSMISSTTGKRHTLLANDAASRIALLRQKDFVAGTTIAPPEETDGGIMIRMLVRFVSTQDLHTHALLEVQQRYSVFEKIIRDATSQKHVLIFDGGGNAIYPYYATADTVNLYRNSNVTVMPKGSSGEREIVAYDRAALAGWTIVVFEPESEFSKPITQMRNLVLIIGIATLIVSIGLIYLISKQLTLPLQNLQHEVQSIALERLGNPAEQSVEPAANNEYEQLRESFIDMQVKLKTSMDAYIEAKREQNETQLLALQSKMHPHFINNILASIQIMASRGETEAVMAICENLSTMLSYSMEDYNGMVSLQEEYQYTNSYIALMKIRYTRRLTYSFDIPEKMLSIRMPKMVLQPLVENSIKHGMKPDGLHIAVSGEIQDGRFLLHVTDNGKGFDKSDAKQYASGVPNCGARRRSPEHGIGLSNIYQRLLLNYGDAAVFTVMQKNGLTTVTIGGIIQEGENRNA